MQTQDQIAQRACTGRPVPPLPQLFLHLRKRCSVSCPLRRCLLSGVVHMCAMSQVAPSTNVGRISSTSRPTRTDTHATGSMFGGYAVAFCWNASRHPLRQARRQHLPHSGGEHLPSQTTHRNQQPRDARSDDIDFASSCAVWNAASAAFRRFSPRLTRRACWNDDATRDRLASSSAFRCRFSHPLLGANTGTHARAAGGAHRWSKGEGSG